MTGMCSGEFRSRQHSENRMSPMVVAQTGPRGASFLKTREKLLAVELAWDHRTHPSGNADERGLFEQLTRSRQSPIRNS